MGSHQGNKFDVESTRQQVSCEVTKAASVKCEGVLIYFYADSFNSVTYINTVNKSSLVWFLQRPIRRSRRKHPCHLKIIK